MRPMTRGLPRSALRSAPTVSARYGKPGTDVRLEVPAGVDDADLSCVIEAVYLARDLINTPANDMGPGELADAAAALARRHGAAVRIIVRR